MDGFGTSEAFGRAENIFDAPPAAQTAALNLLFNPTTGAGFTILRNRIGNGNTASDSIEPNPPSSPMATPAYDFDGFDSGQVWLSQQARALGVKYIYADAWGAPYFMKTNDDLGNGGFLCGVTGETCASGNWLQAYANFLVQYIKFYQTENVTIDYLGFLNEPEFAPSYSSMLSDGQQAADFIKVLHPTLASSGLSNVKIACCDSEGWQNQKTMTADMVSAGVDSEIGIISSHSYTTQPDTPINIDHNVWMTEYADLNGAWDTNWFQSGIFGEGFTWAQLIYNGIVNAGLSAYLYWEGAESDAATNSCLISIEDSGTVIASARLWAMAQWSRYVRPGAVRTATTSGSSSLLTSAFKNTDGTVSVQVLNTATSSQSVTITVSGGSSASVTAFTSNQANGGVPSALAVTLNGGVISATVSASSMTTFILSGVSPAPSSSSSVPPTTTAPTTSPTATTPASGGTVAEFGQCGGIGWTGLTACAAPFTCQVLNPYFSQCL
ncbi:carbohydrate-binding module family 1 protein [Collybiopsis luxurians FD-317 M1]|uniref:Carbohydrate-binding module family 1 protein n=1 Tax=Collybiopsis luxurians FD-317 M1 TaxID=944289 RepID=A0A0D0CW11_9AGAR|nr:carbohydrate-binding module family 1 protein [Collybiopsis luxurians FD-317 M1]